MGRLAEPQDVLPGPELVNVVVAVPPAVRLGRIPQALIHLALPSGHRARIRNWATLIPLMVRLCVFVIAAESATGTPWQNGSFVLAIPGILPGKRAS